jgi:hypothetical protein
MWDIAWDVKSRAPNWNYDYCPNQGEPNNPSHKCCLKTGCKATRYIHHQEPSNKWQPSSYCYGNEEKGKCFCECEQKKDHPLLVNPLDLSLRWSQEEASGKVVNQTLIHAQSLRYKQQMRAIIQLVQKQQMPASTLIVLHTVPAATEGHGALHSHYNEWIRELAGMGGSRHANGGGDADVVLIDWAAMLSGYSQPTYDDTHKPHRCYLRDEHHPRDPYLVAMDFLMEQVNALWMELARDSMCHLLPTKAP